MKTVVLLLILALAAMPLTSAWVACIGQAPDHGRGDLKDTICLDPPVVDDGGGWVPGPPLPPPHP